MKLLLTSGGITNDKISNAFKDLIGKDFADSFLAYIPTALNVEEGDKTWAINSLRNIKKSGFKYIDIVDISVLEKSIWLERLEKVDVIYFEGGNTFHLMRSIIKSGFADEIKNLFQNKIWVGASAGSMVTAPDLCLELSQQLYKEDLHEVENLQGLNLVDFYVVPHLNSKWFTDVTEEGVRNCVKNYKHKVYLLDDQGAIKVNNGKIEIVSDGKYFEI